MGDMCYSKSTKRENIILTTERKICMEVMSYTATTTKNIHHIGYWKKVYRIGVQIRQTVAKI